MKFPGSPALVGSLLLLLSASGASAQERPGLIDERNTTARVRAMIAADHVEMAALASPVAVPLATSAQTSIPIKHWQKDAYVNGELGPPLSDQAHWLGPSGVVQHTHVECWALPWRHTTLESFTTPCQLQAFHLSGRITSFWASWASRIEWQSPSGGWVDQVGGAPPIPVEGDPTGLRIVQLRVTFTPTLAPGLDGNPETHALQSGMLDIPLHGFWHGQLSASTTFDDGAQGNTTLVAPWWSVADTSHVVDWWNEEFVIGSTGELNGPGVPTNAFGKSISYYTNAYLPILAPLTGPVFIPLSGSAYGVSPDLPEGHLEGFLNPNLHHGDPGQLLLSVSGRGFAGGTVFIDPASMLNDGENRLSMTWRQPTTGAVPGTGFTEGLEFTTLFVVPLIKGEGTAPPPPPTTCQDPTATNFGGPLPCTFPPPPPTWETVPGAVIQRQGDLWRVLFPDGKFSQPQPVQ